jgi:hypothetical protein
MAYHRHATPPRSSRAVGTRANSPLRGLHAINGLQYGFPYGDYAGQCPAISVTNPQYAVVAVCW